MSGPFRSLAKPRASAARAEIALATAIESPWPLMRRRACRCRGGGGGGGGGQSQALVFCIFCGSGAFLRIIARIQRRQPAAQDARAPKFRELLSVGLGTLLSIFPQLGMDRFSKFWSFRPAHGHPFSMYLGLRTWSNT